MNILNQLSVKRERKSLALSFALAFMLLFTGLTPGFTTPVYAAAETQEAENISSTEAEQTIDDDIVSEGTAEVLGGRNTPEEIGQANGDSDLASAPERPDGYIGTEFNQEDTSEDLSAIAAMSKVSVAAVTDSSGLVYEIYDGSYGYGAYVTGYSGSGTAVTIPATLEGQPVVSVSIGNKGLTHLYVSEAISLKYLNCNLNDLAALDVSANAELQWLSCDNNELHSLTVAGAAALLWLYCSGNNLTVLDVSANTMLAYLGCNNNELKSLTVAGATTLTGLYCVGNKLTVLDVSTNTALVSLECNNNSLTDLNVSANTMLTTLYCCNNNLVSLTVAGATALRWLDCYNNKLAILDVSANIALGHLYCYNNNLASLTVAGATALTQIDCSNNRALPALDVSTNTALVYLNCSMGNLIELDVSTNTALATLDCGNNNLTALDVRANTALTHLICLSNNIAALDVSTNTALVYLNCYGNNLTDLNVNTNTALSHLNCDQNNLTALDISENTALTSLNCGYNNLIDLDVSANTVLTWLHCSWNNLKSLDVRQNPELGFLWCEDNNLSSLDVSNNPKLTTLYCYNNFIPDSESRQTLVAKFSEANILPQQWKVMFDSQGGSEIEAKAVVQGAAVGGLPTAPAKDGYTFNGWFTAASGGAMVTTATVVTGNVTYYAHWTQGSAVNVVAASLNAEQTSIYMSASNVAVSGNIQGVRFAVWGNANGQNDLRWYTANKSGNNYSFSALVSSHKELGVYNIHAYATLANGQSTFIGATAVTVASLSGTITSPTKNDSAGTFSIRADSIAPASALGGGVRVAVWSTTGGQDDIRWYPMTLSSGTYNANINISNHKYDYGTYNAHVYATQKNGIDQFIGAATVTLTPQPASISSSLNTDQTQISIQANSLIRNPGIRTVQFAVWGNANGQNDLRWYTASKSGNNYSLNVPVSNHREPGVYNIHVYATLTNGQSAFIGSSTVTVASLSGKVSSPSKNDAAGTFSIQASNVAPASLLGSVRVAVWSTAGGQDDIRWYTMPSSSSTYNANINISNHKYDYGTYNAHVYATQKNGVDQFIGAVTVTLTPQPATISSSLNADQTQISIQANSVARIPGVRSVQFAVWGNANGQNDLRWYTANKSGDNYSFNVPVLNHKEPGAYNIHVYATLTNGQSAFIGASTVTVNPLSGKVSSPTKNDAAGTFSVQASDITPAPSLGGVRVAVWSANSGQDDIRWYTLVPSGGTYSLNVNISNHKYDYGTYNAHVYTTQKNGIDQFIGATTVTLAPPAAAITSALNAGQTQISVAANGVVRPGVSAVQFAVWGAANGQNDLRWYNAAKSGNSNNYSLDVPVSNHRESGTYNIHAYATLASGQSVFIGASTVVVQ
jgi:uncharacterized repeat protein (TIGR02543 family)